AGSCVNFKITPKETFKEKCPCSPTEYEIEIENTGSFEENYILNVTKYGQYASLSEPSLKLLPGEKKSVFIFFNLPCEIFGQQDLKINIITEKSKQIAEVSLKLNIKNCYDYTIQSNSEFVLCEGGNTSTLVTITNKALIANAFFVKTSEEFAKVINNTLFLGKNESGNALLTIDASKLRAGQYPFKIISLSERGNDEQEIDAILKVDKCSDFSFKIEEPKEKIIAGGEYTYKLNVKNTGTKNLEFKITIEGITDYNIKEQNFSLLPEEEKAVDIIVKIPTNISGEKNFKIFIDAEGLYAEKQIKLNVIDQIKAYQPDISLKKTKVGSGEDEIIIEIKNIGIAGAEYSLKLEGPSWAQLTENTISLGQKEAAEISIKTFTSEENVEEGEYLFTIIVKTPQSEEAYSKDFKVKVIYVPWYKKAYNFALPYVQAYWPYALIVLAFIILLIFLMWLINKLRKRLLQKRQAKQLLAEAEKTKEQEPLMKEFVSPTISYEAPYRLSLKEPKKKKDWNKFFRIFFILLIIGGVFVLLLTNLSGIKNYFSTPEENIKEEYAPQVEINRTQGIEGYGNVVFIRGEGDLDIPVNIKNRAPSKVIYNIRVANASFISTDADQIELDVNETKTLHLIVHSTPLLSDGIYEITLGLNINEKDLKYSEKIELRIEKEKSFFEEYLPYIIAGVLLAFVLVLVLSVTKKSRFEAKKEKLDIEIRRKKERNIGKKLKFLFSILIICAIIYSLYYYISTLPTPEATETQGSIDLSNFENQTMNIKVGPNQKVIIPLYFENRYNEIAYYYINYEEEWITSDNKRIKLRPGETEQINITIEPTTEAKEGQYNITIEGRVEDITYSKTISLYLVKKKQFSILQNKYFVTGISLVLFGVTILYYVRKKRINRKKFIEEIRQEIVETKQKPKVSKKTKIKLEPKRRTR
ncbi:MAG: hypothetical protein QXG86_03830, partial [Candidatus Woesearchaeota archaeon]